MAIRVLIVDDDFINRKLLHTLLKKNPSVIDIYEANNGSEALIALENSPNIDLILLDIVMPILDGISFLKIFRMDMKYSHIPVIVLSSDDIHKTEMFDRGANDFLRKPIKEEDLNNKIAQWTVV